MKINIVLEKHERRFLYHLLKHLSVPFTWFQQQMAYKFTVVRSNKVNHNYSEVPDLRIEWHPLDREHHWLSNICPMCSSISTRKISKSQYRLLVRPHMYHQQPGLRIGKFVVHYHYAAWTRVMCSDRCKRDWDAREAEGQRIVDEYWDYLAAGPEEEVKCSDCPYYGPSCLDHAHCPTAQEVRSINAVS